MNDGSAPRGATESATTTAIVHDDAHDRECDSLVTVNGCVWTRHEWDAYDLGRHYGYLDGEAVGYERGRAAERDEVERLHTAAAAVVLELAKLPSRDAEADHERAERRAARTYGAAS